MNSTLRCRVVSLVGCLLIWAAGAHAQVAPVPFAPPAAEQPSAPPETTVLQPPAPFTLPPTDQWSTALLPHPDPLLDRPISPPPGWFTNVETNVVGVHFRNQLSIATTLPNGGSDTVNFPGPRMNTTIRPRIEVGYHLPDGWGDLFVGYRFLNTQGGSPVLAAAGPGQTSGRISMNEFDFGYAAQEYSLGPCWDLRWRFGTRVLIFYYDAQLNLTPAASDQGLTLASEHEVNFFAGVGFFGTLELARRTFIPGVSIFGREEPTLQFGHITQTATQTFIAPNSQIYGSQSWEVTVLSLAEQVGLSYTAPGWNHSRILTGLYYQNYFQLGRFTYTSSRGQLDLLGLFLRAEFNF